MTWLVNHGTTTRPASSLVVVCCVAVFLFALSADAYRDLPDLLAPTIDGPVTGPSDLERNPLVRPQLPLFSAADIAALSAAVAHDYDGSDQLLSLTSGEARLAIVCSRASGMTR